MGKTKQLLTICAVLFGFLVINAQMIVKGTVVDDMGDPLPEADVYVKGFEDAGTTTDLDGNYELTVTADQATNGNVTIISSFIGLDEKEDTIAYTEGSSQNLAINFGATSIDEVTVVAQIGYGSAAEEDLTGAVALVTTEDMNQGPIVNAQQLIQGKVPGVNITSSGGAPGAGSTIRIRGTGSLSLNSEPLIVIDGVPIDSGSIGGARNVLNTINPNDIETFSVLKDASATAIYGSRSANGVIIITTKKGKKGKVKWNIASNVSMSDPIRKVDMLNSDQYRTVVNNTGDDAAIGLLGTGNTNWQNQVFDQAWSHDTNISARGAAFDGRLPFRTSVGYTEQNGILIGDQLRRTTGSVSLTPSFLDNHLKVEVNAKGSYTENKFADTGAIGSAIGFDPTQNVYNADGSYFNWADSNGTIYPLAVQNPVMLLNEKTDRSEVRRFIGNAKVDYKLHFLPDLTATVNLGIDETNAHGRKYNKSGLIFTNADQTGYRETYRNVRTNRLFDAYLTYDKKFGDNHKLDAMIGHSYQVFDQNDKNDNYSQIFSDGSSVYNGTDEIYRNTLLSYFGRVNYAFKGKYLVTATLRADASSKLNPDDRWGYFPSVALAWNLHKENFLAESNTINNLKLRLGWGQIGNISGLEDYQYLTRYRASENGQAYYQFGDEFTSTYRPDPFNEDLKWEVGETFNAGIDYGLFNDRISGSLDGYYKKTKDLIAYVNVDPFTNFGSRLQKNIGDMENYGVELNLNVVPIQKQDFEWSIGYNLSYNHNEITKLSTDQLVGGISGGTGNNVQIQREGESAYSFYTYEQVYDENGRPIEGVYVDRNQDGVINDDDRYINENPFPDITMGLNTNLNYKNWDLAVVTRANFNNYVYNNNASALGYGDRITGNGGPFLANIHEDYLHSNFQSITSESLRSDYYVENASFFKVDNITLGYTIPRDLTNNFGIRVYGSVQNVAMITDYDGLDPEIITGDFSDLQPGIDNNVYPRPRIFLLGLNIDF